MKISKKMLLMEFIFSSVTALITVTFQNAFHALVSFYSPWKYQKTWRFLVFPGGIERDQCHKMDYKNSIVCSNFMETSWNYWTAVHICYVRMTASQIMVEFLVPISCYLEEASFVPKLYQKVQIRISPGLWKNTQANH